jgi:glycosyltransferase involved in cell wall biosynthesis
MVKRKKILLSAYACEPDGGPEAIIGWNFAKNLAKHHQVWVVTRESNRKNIEKHQKTLLHHQINFIYFDLPKILRFWKKGSRGHRLYYFLWQIGIFFKTKNLIRKEQIDIVHHVTFVNYWQPSFLPFLKKVNFVFGPVGGGEYVKWDFIKHFPLKELLYEMIRNSSKFINIANPLLRIASVHTKLVIAANKETAEQLEKIGYKNINILTQVALDNNQIRMLKNTTDNDKSSFRFVSVGRLLTWKGFDMAIEAFAELAKYNNDVEYYIIGEGPFRSYLEKKIKENRLEHRVNLLGKLSQESLFKLLSQCDVLVHPSLHDSGALVVAEAMAAGKPVICLDVGGPAYQVNKDVGMKVAVISRKQVIHDLKKAMELFLKDENLYRKMSLAARERVEKELNWDYKIKIINDLYNHIVN